MSAVFIHHSDFQFLNIDDDNIEKNLVNGRRDWKVIIKFYNVIRFTQNSHKLNKVCDMFKHNTACYKCL